MPPGPDFSGDAFIVYTRNEPDDGDRQHLAPEVVPEGTKRLAVVFFRGGDNFDSDDASVLFFPTDEGAGKVFAAFRIRMQPNEPEFAKRFFRRGNVVVLWNRGFDSPEVWKQVVLSCLRGADSP
jgi:hypothetical protein